MLCRFLVFMIPFVGAAHAHAAQATLCNDGFQAGDSAAFQGGFVAGEMAAVKLTAPADGFPYQVLAVHLLFGDTTGTTAGKGFTVNFHIFDDTGTSSVNGFEGFPGTLLATQEAALLSSSDGINEAPFETPFTVNSGAIWLAIEVFHNGEPSIARDDTGVGSGPRNAIFASGGWESTATFGVDGDWIMRAVVDTPSTQTNDACVFDDAPVGEGEGEPAEGEGEGEGEPGEGEGEGEGDAGDLVVTSINPATAAVGETVVVTITGAGFDATTTFRIGAAACGQQQILNAGAAQCTYPGTLPEGIYDVIAQNGGGAPFTFPSGFIVTGGGCGCRTTTTAPLWFALLGLLVVRKVVRRSA